MFETGEVGVKENHSKGTYQNNYVTVMVYAVEGYVVDNSNKDPIKWYIHVSTVWIQLGIAKSIR